jgi:hypothetical protein
MAILTKVNGAIVRGRPRSKLALHQFTAIAESSTIAA